MLSKPDETIHWIDVDDEIPDDSMMVLVFIPEDNDPIWLGYYDSQDGWCGVAGMPFDVSIVAWAEMPIGPGRNEASE